MAFLTYAPKVTKNLILINVIIYIATLINERFIIGSFALFYPASPFFHIWQPVTHMFVHGGFFHIFFNMYALLMFGSAVEQIIGQKKFLTLYMVCGLGAAGLHLAVQAISGGSSIPCVGASGAIYGVILTYAILFPDSRMTLLFPPVTLTARKMVIVFLVIEVLTGVFGSGYVLNISDGIAHFAHIGGMLFGFLLVKYWKFRGTLFDRG
ncbi:MAG: rhomboid family intramembrane serine protease [Bacteroidales bacterium]|nr:rhomboid family intramembrane serine protease [Bacteroidales bacterium]